ncbi:MAG TPA: VOC family protein [Devosia sp.]|nr:VOC family protein [Devosia sp.]
MQLNHANLIVADVAATRDFFIRHFGFTVRFGGTANFVVLTDEAGFVLNLMAPGKSETVAYPKNFHIGFFVADAATVVAKQAELGAAGHEPSPVQDFNRAGERTRTFYCTCPGGFMVEVAHSEAA